MSPKEIWQEFRAETFAVTARSLPEGRIRYSTENDRDISAAQS